MATKAAPKKKATAKKAAPKKATAAGDDAPASSTSAKGKRLVIVESPAKAKTINKYLGNDYIVRASMGHIRDLPHKGMAVDLKTFEPQYEIITERGKGKLVAELKKLAKTASDVYLATDLDREGEAIAWHLKEALNIPDERVKRVIFNAITKAEIQKAFSKPTRIDIDRVNAQQARRILDRVVGYEISPILWKKVARGLSAGRVQSVAVRLVVEREREIEAFVPEESWKVGGIFAAKDDPKLITAWADWLGGASAEEPRTKQQRQAWLGDHGAFAADLVEFGGAKFDAHNVEQARAVVEALGFKVESVNTTDNPDGKGPQRTLTEMVGHVERAGEYRIRSVEKKRTTSRPPAPFITSTLQQGASSRLSYGAQKTMRVAQTLYEQGHITYMRTDSTNLSADAVNMARDYIEKQFGPNYLPAKANVYSSSNKSAQEAHEAIRPTDLTLTPASARNKLGPDDLRLYTLIYNRFLACQMSPAEFDQTALTVVTTTEKGDAVFRATGRKLVFDGFMRVAGVSSEDQLLPDVVERDRVYPIELAPTQHFSSPPPRYTEASLVKELEAKGIGRPSTYASIISTIEKREYVAQQQRRFYATLLGKVVTDKLIQAFPDVMDVAFTADMEGKLDDVENATVDWVKLLQDFYGPFHGEVDGALEKLDHAGGTASEYTCPESGDPMVYRISKNGFFLACSDKECSHTQPVDLEGKPKLREKSEYQCPRCGRDMMKRSGRFGDFLGCTGYSEKTEAGEPACSLIINLDKDGKPTPPKPQPVATSVPCEKCGSPMLLRDSKRGPFLGCSTFPKCRSTKMVGKLPDDQQKYVEGLMPELRERQGESARLVAKLLGNEVAGDDAGVRAGAVPPNGQAVAPVNVQTDIDCDECGKPMTVRKGRRGPFLGCSGYPKCKNTAELPASLAEKFDAPAKAPAEPSAA